MFEPLENGEGSGYPESDLSGSTTKKTLIVFFVFSSYSPKTEVEKEDEEGRGEGEGRKGKGGGG